MSLSNEPYTLQPGVAGPGSAYIEYGQAPNTVRMIAVIIGPKQHTANKPSFEVDVSFAGFFSKDKQGTEIGGDIATYLREGIEQSIDLDAYPHMMISVYIKVLDGPISCVDAYLVPGMLLIDEAIRNGNINMVDTVLCTSILLQTDESATMDGSESSAQVTVGIQAKSGQVTLLHQTGLLQDGAAGISRAIQLAQSLLKQGKVM